MGDARLFTSNKEYGLAGLWLAPSLLTVHVGEEDTGAAARRRGCTPQSHRPLHEILLEKILACKWGEKEPSGIAVSRSGHLEASHFRNIKRSCYSMKIRDSKYLVLWDFKEYA